MKNRIILLVALFISGMAFGQKDSLPPYKQFPVIPAFKIQLMDSTTWFTKANLSSRKPTLIIYFSPDCGHCQLETEQIISNIKSLQKIQIVMATSRPFPDVKNFADHYLLNRFANIKVGVDPARFLVNYYTVQFTPFAAFYDKRGKLVKVYEKGINWEEFLPMVQ